MRFALVDQAKKDFPVHRLCQVLGVSQSGYFAWKADRREAIAHALVSRPVQVDVREVVTCPTMDDGLPIDLCGGHLFLKGCDVF